MKLWLLIFSMFFTSTLSAQQVRGFNLTEDGDLRFVANPSGEEKSSAQIIVDNLRELGVNHLVLNLRAKMVGPRSSDIVPSTGNIPIATEARELSSFIRYIKSKDMSVGLRPIVFVVGPNGEFPYTEILPDGSEKVWWHGNIQPQDPNRWFENFQRYLDRYLTIARVTKVEEFTIGAELYSMTVGIEDQWKEHPYGSPGRWNELLGYTRSRLGDDVRLMYDINFTDDLDRSTGIARSGGELERWRYRLVDLAYSSDPAQEAIWRELVEFWQGLDAIGIDMYRSLGFRNDVIPSDYESLVNLLSQRATAYAEQLDITLLEISFVTEQMKPVILKEVGFRSVENTFIDPFTYATSLGEVNIEHQAAGYEALFRGFWEPGFEWFDGFAFWDAPINLNRHGVLDRGFSPIGKEQTEDVLRSYFLR